MASTTDYPFFNEITASVIHPNHSGDVDNAVHEVGIATDPFEDILYYDNTKRVTTQKE
jgi:hypothetical protein